MQSDLSLGQNTQRAERLREKKENVFNQKSLGSASRRTSTERRKTWKNLFLCKKHKTEFSQSFWGLLYRSTGQNINGPNINELQINCSIGQQKPVDVQSIILTNMRSDQLLHTSTNIAKKLTQREKRLREQNIKCPKSNFYRICLKESFHRENKD